MASLITNQGAEGFGAQSGVAVASSSGGFFASGLADGWYIDIYFSDTDDIATAVQVVEPSVDPMTGRQKKRNYLRITQNGPMNFSWLPAAGYLWAYLRGGRTAVTVNLTYTEG